MVSKFKHKLLVTAMLSTVSIYGFSAGGIQTTSKKESETQRYIIKYKSEYKSDNHNLAQSSAKEKFNSTAARHALEQKGIEVKLELAKHHSLAAVLTESMLADLKSNAEIESIELDPIRKPMAIYNDTAGDPTTTQLTPYAVFQYIGQASMLM